MIGVRAIIGGIGVAWALGVVLGRRRGRGGIGEI